MAQQKVKIKIDKDFTPVERAAIASDVIDFIIERSQSGKDKKNRDFPSYSKSYINSFDFKLAGKSKKPNLTLSGEMLNALTLLNHSKGEIVIGIPKDDTFNNAKAEGNIKGTYGSKTPNSEKARDFMGITKKDLTNITKEFKVNADGSNRADILRRLLASESSRQIADRFFNTDGVEDDV